MEHHSLVETTNLVKVYKNSPEPAVDKLSLSIREGEIFGLLGPNGSGKTTTISILCGLLKPTSGKVKIDGACLPHALNQVKPLIGVVSQNIALYKDLTAFENLWFFGGLYGIEKGELREKVNHNLELLGLYKYRNQRIRKFSGGMKRRVNLLAGILHEPRMLFLDEPTAGVDVQSRKVMLEYLTELNRQNTTMLYSSHYLEEAEKFCSRVAVIDAGKVIGEGAPEQLIKQNKDCRDLEDLFIKLTGRKLRDS